MKVSTLLQTIFFSMLITVALNAQEVNESYNCHEKYSMCTEKCEELQSGIVECVAKCEPQYDQCLEKEENPQQDSE